MLQCKRLQVKNSIYSIIALQRLSVYPGPLLSVNPHTPSPYQGQYFTAVSKPNSAIPRNLGKLSFDYMLIFPILREDSAATAVE